MRLCQRGLEEQQFEQVGIVEILGIAASLFRQSSKIGKYQKKQNAKKGFGRRWPKTPLEAVLCRGDPWRRGFAL